MPPSSESRAAATVRGSVLDGWKRVVGTPTLTVLILVVTLVTALPMAALLGNQIEAHLGRSADADGAATGWHSGWAAEFNAEARGFETTFTHEILGFGATLGIISGLVDADWPSPPILLAIGFYLCVWIFLTGGILDRLARQRPVGVAAFTSISGEFFVRFLRLAILVAPVYWALFAWLHPWLFIDVYNDFARDMTVEAQAVWLRGSLYVVFLAALAFVSTVADFAKVRAVVEDRRSMIGAVSASLRFIQQRLGRVMGLYLVNVLLLAAILLLWSRLAPSADVAPWWALLITQAYLLLRVWARLAFMASEIAFFQGELAHAHYAAVPEPVWPDSPSAEAIENLKRGTRP